MSHLDPFSESTPMMKTLQDHGVELDQLLREAFKMALGLPIPFDSNVFHALNRLNAVSARLFDIDSHPGVIFDQYLAQGCGDEGALARFRPEHLSFAPILNRAFSQRAEANTLGTVDFLKAVVAISIERAKANQLQTRTGQMLAEIYSGDRHRPLSKVREAHALLEALESSVSASQDFQYVLALEGRRVVFRLVSVLDDYAQQADSGLFVPQRALLTHHNQQFASFTPDQVAELEDLLNSGRSSEADFQNFFERYPHFLRRWDHRSLHSQVYLTREEDGPLIPDFILVNEDVQQAFVVDLKLPSAKIIRRQRNRDRFSAALTEARAQLLEYRDWFEEQANRVMLKAQLGMEVYRPRLSVVIGRSNEFQCPFDRQKLQSREPELEIATYDDILQYARRRLLFMAE